MESKKISNGQEFIQPDSILLPQKEKKFTRQTRYIRDAYIKNKSPPWNGKKSKRLRRAWAVEGWASEAADWGLGAEGGG